MLQNRPFALEVCVESACALPICAKVADRIELCSGLEIGGLTPSIGLMQQAKRLGIETHVLIRPRVGDFAFTEDDLAVALADIATARDIGMAGVVIGAVADGALDQPILQRMIRAADGMVVTLHRAFDVVDDHFAALDTAIALGFDRILTSGGARSAYAGVERLAALQEHAGKRISLMAGAGINSANVTEIARRTGIKSFHASCSQKSATKARYAELGFGAEARMIDKEELTALEQALASHFGV